CQDILANPLAGAMALEQSKLSRHVKRAKRQASSVGLGGKSPIIPTKANPPRPRDRQQQRAGPVVPEADGLVMTVARQELARVAERNVGDLPGVASQDARLAADEPVPDVDLAIVARGCKQFSIGMPRQGLDARGCGRVRLRIGSCMRQR